MQTEIKNSAKLTDSLNAVAMKTVKIKELYVELRKYEEELAKVHNMSSVASKLFENEKFNHRKPANGRRYTDFIRNLSVNLSFYSQAGYEKLRTIFTLPSLDVLTTATTRRRNSRVTTKNDLTKPFNPYFKHPSTNEPVYVMLDACHMLKLARG